MILRHNPSRLEEKADAEAVGNSWWSWMTNVAMVGALRERVRQLEAENAQLRLQVQVLRELLRDE